MFARKGAAGPTLALFFVLSVAVHPAAAQMAQTEGGVIINEDAVRTARETASHSNDTPDWDRPPGFEHDVFTFARLIAKSRYRSGTGRFRSGYLGWSNDYPDSDLNLSYRLQQLTALKVDPDGRVLKATDPDLFRYPLIYLVQAGRMEFRETELDPLRRYLAAGGVLFADDFWGDQEWENFAGEMDRVLPGHAWVELPIEHPIFHCVFNFTDKSKLQVPPIQIFERTGSSSREGALSREVHVRAWLDDKGRIMVLATHNTDLGDGWERETENPEFFTRFSEPRAYPFAINIIVYLMTH